MKTILLAAAALVAIGGAAQAADLPFKTAPAPVDEWPMQVGARLATSAPDR
jgi:opacity protein-like surface antigen